jgi:2-polyprenyl-3-methyl-5-hydroxy-6-metoxy-1,4-benzoquinol methylase
MSLPYQLKKFPRSSHDLILKTLSGENRPLRILEVGTAAGYLGHALRDRGHRIVGIELDPEAADRARPFYEQVYVSDLENFEFPWREEFDWVLFADVLEHLRDPMQVLKRAIPCVKRCGKILISVPNVANVVVRLGLLVGRFEYTERGILDRTHLRFFTLRSLKKMLDQAGLRILDVQATPLPVQLVFPFTNANPYALLHHIHYAAVRLRKQLLAYQFVVTVERTGSFGAF